METLRTLAIQTDGRAHVSRNQNKNAMKHIVRETPT
jgi:hypothetical protein